VTSAANPHYQKRFDVLHKLAAAGDWAAVRDYKVSGSCSGSAKDGACDLAFHAEEMLVSAFLSRWKLAIFEPN
jgi:hypothetical protein